MNYNVGDIFEIEQAEYRLDYININNYCWLAPVLRRYSTQCVTGGMNKLCHYEKLKTFKYITTI